MITISGSTDVGAYVYCGVTKNPTVGRRMLNATDGTKTGNTTTATPTTTAAKAATPAEPVNLQSKATSLKYDIRRFETKTGKLDFSFKYTGLKAGYQYAWLCEATSLSPSSPAFRTAMVEGKTSTDKPPVPVGADSALWSSLFAAVLMIAAVFFY